MKLFAIVLLLLMGRTGGQEYVSHNIHNMCGLVDHAYFDAVPVSIEDRYIDKIVVVMKEQEEQHYVEETRKGKYLIYLNLGDQSESDYPNVLRIYRIEGDALKNVTIFKIKGGRTLEDRNLRQNIYRWIYSQEHIEQCGNRSWWSYLNPFKNKFCKDMECWIVMRDSLAVYGIGSDPNASGQWGVQKFSNGEKCLTVNDPQNFVIDLEEILGEGNLKFDSFTENELKCHRNNYFYADNN